MAERKYRIIVDDNFHFMDESESYDSGSFSTYEEAVAKCKIIIDDFLKDAVRPGDTSEGLYSTFIMYGETPHIDGEKLGNFSALEYAKWKCQELTSNETIKKDSFLVRPFPGETLDDFQFRLNKLLSDREKNKGP